MQDLPSDDLDKPHESMSFLVNLDKFEFQEPPVPGSGYALGTVKSRFALQSSCVDCISSLPGRMVTLLTESREPDLRVTKTSLISDASLPFPSPPENDFAATK